MHVKIQTVMHCIWKSTIFFKKCTLKLMKSYHKCGFHISFHQCKSIPKLKETLKIKKTYLE
jgi:hypothetical protein